MTSALFKDFYIKNYSFSNHIYLMYKSINSIWYQITNKSWHAVKHNQHLPTLLDWKSSKQYVAVKKQIRLMYFGKFIFGLEKIFFY